MSSWREQSYGEREFGLVSEELRSRSWMPRELALTLNDALEALDCFEGAGVSTVQWDTYQGFPGGEIGGQFMINGMGCICGSAADFSIAEARKIFREEDARLRADAEDVHEVIFCLMIMA